MKWFIVFYMLTSAGTPDGPFIVDGHDYVSQAKCERAIEQMGLPKKPHPMCVQMGSM